MIGRVHPLGTNEFCIGRVGGDAELAFDDDLISRRHSSLAFDVARRAHVIQDLGSTNGTFINGVAIDSEVLELGDIVRVGP